MKRPSSCVDIIMLQQQQVLQNCYMYDFSLLFDIERIIDNSATKLLRLDEIRTRIARLHKEIRSPLHRISVDCVCSKIDFMEKKTYFTQSVEFLPHCTEVFYGLC